MQKSTNDKRALYELALVTPPGSCVKSVNYVSQHSLPGTGVTHAGPGLLGLQCITFLQQFNGDIIRRADKGHMAITGRAIDGYAFGLELLAQLIDIIHPERQVPEIAATGVLLRIPVVGQLHHWRLTFPGTGLVFRSGQEHQCKAALLAVFTGDFHHTQQVAEEVESVVQIADSNHRMQVLHSWLLNLMALKPPQFTLFSGHDDKRRYRNPTHLSDTGRAPPGVAVLCTAVARSPCVFLSAAMVT